jgi:hypothetical protein
MNITHTTHSTDRDPSSSGFTTQALELQVNLVLVSGVTLVLGELDNRLRPRAILGTRRDLRRSQKRQTNPLFWLVTLQDI